MPDPKTLLILQHSDNPFSLELFHSRSDVVRFLGPCKFVQVDSVSIREFVPMVTISDDSWHCYPIQRPGTMYFLHSKSLYY